MTVDYINMENLETQTESPIENLKIGEQFSYKGYYNTGLEEGISKIKRFYKEHISSNKNHIWMELENEKIILLGFETDGDFKMSSKFQNKSI